MVVVASVCVLASLVTIVATLGLERRAAAPVETEARAPVRFGAALKATWGDPGARAFTGFVFLSILAFYLSELILEPFAGHIHGLTPEDSTKLSGGKDGAALLGMIAAGALSHFRVGSLKVWAMAGCVISAAGLLGLGFGLPLVPSTVVLGLGNGLFVVGAIGSMMQLAAERERRTGMRMGVFGAAQAVAAGLAGVIATATLDVARLALSDQAAYGTVFTIEAVLFLAAACVAAQVMRPMRSTTPSHLVPGE
jgi:BCD family chlorophyll transporter-like MFS transporter